MSVNNMKEERRSDAFEDVYLTQPPAAADNHSETISTSSIAGSHHSLRSNFTSSLKKLQRSFSPTSNQELQNEKITSPTQTSRRPLEVHTRNTTMMQGIFNLTKSSIGAGMLFLPWNMHRMGLFAGLTSIVFAGILCSSTLHYLARMCANTGADDYFKLGRLAFGQYGETTAVAALLFNLLGGLINYANFAGDYMSSALVYLFGINEAAVPWYMGPSFLKIAIATFAIFPLSCLRDMSKLARSSLAGLLCMGYLLALTVVDLFVDGATYKAPRFSPVISTQFFSAFGSIIFAFVNHFTIVAVVPVMIKPTPSRRTQMIIFSNTTVIAVYLLAAICGYLHFGSSINPAKPDILNSPKTMSVPYAIAKLAFASVMVFSYPLLCYPARSALDQLIGRLYVNQSLERSEKWARWAPSRHYLETAVLVAVPTAIAVLAANMAALFLDVFSSLCGSLIVFVFPALYFMRLAQPKLYNFPIHLWERAFVAINIIVGLAVACIGTFDSVATMIRVLVTKA